MNMDKYKNQYNYIKSEKGKQTQSKYLQSDKGNINAVTSGIEDKNVHCYLIFDQHYYFNEDGSVTFSN